MKDRECLICFLKYQPKSNRSLVCSDNCRKIKNRNYNKQYLAVWKLKNPQKHEVALKKWRTSKSCKTYQNHYQKQLRKSNEKVRLNQIWYGIVYRCTSQKAKQYKDYGGRGIKCEWRDFLEFYTDMSSSYKPGLTIDRVDVNKNYCKSNCRWIRKGEQALNRRNTIVFKLNGEKIGSLRLSKILDVERHKIINDYKRKNIYEYTK